MEIAAHKFALMSASSHFFKLFTDEQAEAKKIRVVGYDPEAFRSMIRCALCEFEQNCIFVDIVV